MNSSFPSPLSYTHWPSTLQWPISFQAAIGTVAITYLSIVQALRWRRYNAIHRKYEHKYRAGTLTPEEAQEIILVSALYDMPALVNFALSFALFKTYAIPSISKILSGTKELQSAERISKRYADTEILISTWVFCPISGRKSYVTDSGGSSESPVSSSQSSDTKNEVDDPRAMIALARVNWLHSKYPIKNDDHLYTLGLFIFEGGIWARLYGWRALSSMETQAFFIFWTEIGRRMGIKDIPETPEAYKQWIAEYEDKVMIPAQTNHDVATYTTEELIHAIPELYGLKNFARRLTICALNDKVRIAMMQPEQPTYLHLIFKTILYFVAFIQGYLCLPRSQSNPGGAIVISLDKATGSTTANTHRNPNTYPTTSQNVPESTSSSTHLHRMHPRWFQAKPWYMPSPQTLLGKLKVKLGMKLGLYDAMPDPGLRNEGYRLEEMGPLKFEKSGHDEVIHMAEEMYGCPIAGPFSRRK